ncbi:MAG: family 20 glycosylhydrolase [Saprospiraceae bacterium]
MRFTLLPVLLFITGLFACQQINPSETGNSYPVIPKPQKLSERQGRFTVPDEVSIIFSEENEDLQKAGTHLKDLLEQAGVNQVELSFGKPENGAFNFIIDNGIAGGEAYKLEISKEQVTVRSSGGAGAFYAVQTIRQLMPVEVEKGPVEHLSLPCAEIEDAPRFSYRGMHLDVGRHFFPVEFVKKYIDLLAFHKFNRFHWHLTEDQGWRIEIKKYPRLQEVAACRDETLVGHYNDQPHQYDGKRYCGYYTQEEAREIVRYANERFITVIPEIEMPGHAQAAVAAYPELGCTGKPVEVAKRWGIFEDVYCPNEETFEFLENVLTEVMDIFPSEFIHIGGDECPKTQWKTNPTAQAIIEREGLKDEHELQSWFIQRMERFLNDHGRNIIGWDEILEGGLAPNATVMSWRGTEGGIAAAKQHHKVIMTPTDYCYFDYYQSQDPDEPLAIGGYLPLEKVYSYEPIPEELSEEEAKYILGAQGNVWTEYMQRPEHVEYMVFPRACAMAEVNWTNPNQKDYDDFLQRLSTHLERLKAMGVNAAEKIYDTRIKALAGDGNGIRIEMAPDIRGLKIHYTTDGSAPTAESPVYKAPFSLDNVQANGTSIAISAQAFMNGTAKGKGSTLTIEKHKAAGKKISLSEEPAPKYSGNGPGSLINGVPGPTERYGGSEWLGFDGKDLEAVIDFGQPTAVSKVSTLFYHAPGQWIYAPKGISVAVSEDGQAFREVANLPVAAGEEKLIAVDLPFDEVETRFLKITARRFGLIPEGAQGAGHEAWLFVDELVVE